MLVEISDVAPGTSGSFTLERSPCELFCTRALDLAHAGEIVIERAAVRRPQPATQRIHLAGDHVEQARGLLREEAPFGDGVARPEQAQEQLARIALDGQRCGGRAERKRAGVAAAIAPLARTACAVTLRGGGLERWPGCFLSDVFRRNLVDGGRHERHQAFLRARTRATSPAPAHAPRGSHPDGCRGCSR